MSSDLVALLYQTKYRLHLLLDWELDGTLRGALADVAYAEWLAKEPGKAQEYAHSWTAEIDINYIRGELTVSLYPEEWDEQT